MEAKQYSVDVAIAVILWWTFTALKTRLDDDQRRAWALVTLVGAVALWFSHPAIFVVGGVSIHSLGQAFRVGSRRSLALRACAALVWVGSFVVLYFVSLRYVSADLHNAWRGAALPLVPLSSRHFTQYYNVVWTLGVLPLGRQVMQLVTLGAALGVIALWRRGDRQGAWFAGTLALVWIASSLGQYPLAHRLWLFLAPAVILVVAAGVDEVWRRTRSTFPMLAPIFACLLLAYPTLAAVHTALRPREKEEIRQLLQHAQKQYREGDVLYVYPAAQFAARYYAGRGLGFPGAVVIGTERAAEQSRDQRRVWMLFAHVYRPEAPDDEKLLVRLLDRVGAQLEATRTTGASLYLYDLSRAP